MLCIFVFVIKWCWINKTKSRTIHSPAHQLCSMFIGRWRWHRGGGRHFITLHHLDTRFQQNFYDYSSWNVCVLCFYGRFLFGFVFVSSADRLFSTNISKYFDDNDISLFSGIVLFCAWVCVIRELEKLSKKTSDNKVCISHHTFHNITHSPKL